MLKRGSGTTLYEQVMEQIKDMIAQGVYGQGDLLPSEKELIQLTGVSRITVREALKGLAEVGIIETRRGKGSFVRVDSASLRPDMVTSEERSAYRQRFLASTQARLLVEPEIARLAAKNASPEDIAALEALLQRKNNPSRGERCFDEFHIAVARAAGNPVLVDFIRQMVSEEQKGLSSFSLPMPENQKRASGSLRDQHQKILSAIRDGDGEFAYFYTKEHIQYVVRAYEEYFALFC